MTVTQSAVTPGPAIHAGDPRTDLTVEALIQDFLANLFYVQGRFRDVATPNDNYMALAYTVRDRIMHRWINTAHTYFAEASRTVCYLSAEFLLGPQLGKNLVNLGIQNEVRSAMQALELDLDELLEQEEEPGLGNGGLGRLAACFLDSLATQEIPTIGYGIRYEFGIFDQEIVDGWQVERTDKWLRFGNPWEIPRPEIAFDIKLGGHTEPYTDDQGHYRVRWIPDRVVKGVAFDTPILGYRVNTAILLRLWKAEAPESFDFQAFNIGDYLGAVDAKISSENITKVLYPNDEPVAGKQLRLEQQYFFTACALRDMVRIHRQRAPNLDDFHLKYAVQLNDTHPAIAVPELMRILVDDYHYAWETAWRITGQTFAYTNHTLLAEALETWSVWLLGAVLPRHLEIIYEINRRLLDGIRIKYPGDGERAQRLSLIDESGEGYVRMAQLASVGSHAINGVSALHTRLLAETVLRDTHEVWPSKFRNKTNGVSPRRFLALSNPGVTALITEAIGDGWLTDMGRLRQLEALCDDAAFQAGWRAVKQENKEALQRHIDRTCGRWGIDPTSLFDVQVKRIHEFKRQHLNLLHVIHRYRQLRADPAADLQPRTFIFGGKAAPSYSMAKLIIKAINAVGETINRDEVIGERIKVIFVPDFNVTNGQRIYPAAELSEQISTAGKEASGTGNMKFAMNGALTIGTLDGANVEIREEIGPENFFNFGLSAADVEALARAGYRPEAYYAANEDLRAALDMLVSGVFSHGDTELFRPLVESLIHQDPFFVLADFAAYIDAQAAVDRAYQDPAAWTRRSILNTARIGPFSSDRAIAEYCQDIWNVAPVPVTLSLEAGNSGCSERVPTK